MSHPDEGSLRTLLDGEATPEEARALEGHLATCRPCARTLEGMRDAASFLTGRLALLDVVPPTERVRARLGSSASARVASAAPAPPRAIRRWPADLARAAALVLGFAGMVAAAVHPASPLRRWIHRDEPAPALARASAPAPAAAPAAREVGVRLAVPSSGVTVSLADAAAGTLVEVTWTEGGTAAVYAAEGTSFGTSESEGRIDAATVAGPVRIELPRSAARAVVVVGGRTYLEKTGERIDFPGPPALVDGPRVRFAIP